MDGSKTGLSVLPAILSKDSAQFNERFPRWKETKEDSNKHAVSGINKVSPKRPRTLGAFVMDTLHEQAKIEGDRQLKAIEQIFSSCSDASDPALMEPWLTARQISQQVILLDRSSRVHFSLEKIEAHVRTMYDKHRGEFRQGIPVSPSKRKDKGAAFTELPIETRQDKIRSLSREFAEKPTCDEVYMDKHTIARLRASCAYWHDSRMSRRGWSRFPWDVATRDLCAIKAESLGPSKTVTMDFYERFSLKHLKST